MKKWIHWRKGLIFTGIFLFLLSNSRVFARIGESEPMSINLRNPEYEYYLKHPEDYPYGLIPPKFLYQLPKETIEEVPDAEFLSLPSSYDARKDSLISSVKDQGQTGTCWAHSVFGAIESFMKKQTGKFYDFSEMHMAYNMDAETDLTSGAHCYKCIDYFSRPDGPVFEQDFPSAKDAYEATNGRYYLKGHQFLEDYGKKKGKMYIGDMTIVPKNEIKKYIKKYGSVSVVYSAPKTWESNYYTHKDPNDDEMGYHFPYYGLNNHAITVVGWDDHKKITTLNGLTTTGAFIGKNSWGTEYGDGGYFWISYATIDPEYPAVVYSNIGENPDNVYKFDDFGWNRSYTTYDPYVLANLFYRDTKEPETVSEVSFHKIDSNRVKYTVWIIENEHSVQVVEKVLDRAGYYTLPVSQPVKVSGEHFTIKLEIEPLSGPATYGATNASHKSRGYSYYLSGDEWKKFPDNYRISLNAVMRNETSSTLDLQQASVASIPDQMYTGSPIEPKPVVTYNGESLFEGTDYTLSYAQNVDPGTAYVMVKGIGKYTGIKSEPFKIIPSPYKNYKEWKPKIDISPSKEWKISFNHPLARSTVNTDHIFVVRADQPTEKIPVRLELSPDRRTVTVHPVENYLPGGEFLLIIQHLETDSGSRLRQNVKMQFQIRFLNEP